MYLLLLTHSSGGDLSNKKKSILISRASYVKLTHHLGLILGWNIPISRLYRKTVWMSARRVSPWLCRHVTLGYGLFLLVTFPDVTTGRQGNCSHPLVPEHGGFRCEPSPCRGFVQKSLIYYFCEPGYAIPKETVRSLRCQHGKWFPSVPTCLSTQDRHDNFEEQVDHSLPSVATTAVGVSIFLLTTTACLIIKSRLFRCHSHRRSSDQMDLMVDGLSVSLPTYEEAVYGSWGQRLPPCRGPTQLLLAQEAPGPSLAHNQSDSSHRIDPSNQSPDILPPPYEEIESHPREGQRERDVRALQVALSDDKDI